MTVVVSVIVGIVVVAAALLPAGLFWRCRKVDLVRAEKLRDSYEQAAQDMSAGLPWEWRFEAFRTGPTFTQMVWRVWRPVDSFYPDRPAQPVRAAR